MEFDTSKLFILVISSCQFTCSLVLFCCIRITNRAWPCPGSMTALRDCSSLPLILSLWISLFFSAGSIPQWIRVLRICLSVNYPATLLIKFTSEQSLKVISVCYGVTVPFFSFWDIYLSWYLFLFYFSSSSNILACPYLECFHSFASLSLIVHFADGEANEDN